MRGMPFETCWAFNERWNNKFYYKVASCWLFLLIHFSLSLWQAWLNSSTYAEELSPTGAFPGCKIYHLLPLCDHANPRRTIALVHFHIGLHGVVYRHVGSIIIILFAYGTSSRLFTYWPPVTWVSIPIFFNKHTAML